MESTPRHGRDAVIHEPETRHHHRAGALARFLNQYDTYPVPCPVICFRQLLTGASPLFHSGTRTDSFGEPLDWEEQRAHWRRPKRI